VEKSTYAVAVPEDKEKKQVVLRLDLENGTCDVCVELPVMIKKRRSVCPTEQFVLYCDQRSVNLLPYKGVKVAGSKRFKFEQNYPGVFHGDIIFKSVTVVQNNAFAVLSLGRVYCWYVLYEIFA
jgi:hypothetical protein